MAPANDSTLFVTLATKHRYTNTAVEVGNEEWNDD